MTLAGIMVADHNMGVTTMKATINIAKTGESVEFDSDTLPEASNLYAWTYGLTQSVNDATASVVRKNFENQEDFELEARTKAQKRIDQIMSGDVPGSRAPADPAKKRAQIVSFLAKLSPDERKALLAEARATV
jgi:hypothetical protein